jgi:Trm5-related predicted tRNA methylase
MDADAFEVVFQTCAALVGKVVVDEERREGGFVERRVGQCGDREGEIPAERLSARGGIEGVPVRLFVERIRDL